MKYKKEIMKFLFNNKINILILFILPIINIIFNGLVFSKQIGLTIKYINESNLSGAKQAVLTIIVIAIILQFLRYLQRMCLSSFLTRINAAIKRACFERFTGFSIPDMREQAESVNKLAEEIVEAINITYSFIYRPLCVLIIGIVGFMFINITLGKILLAFSLIFFSAFPFMIKKPIINSGKLEDQQRMNKSFVNDIARNAFIEKIFKLKNFTNGIFNNHMKKEDVFIKQKYNSIAKASLYGNLLCQCTLCIMLFITVTSSLPVETMVSFITLSLNFFADFNEFPNQIIPLLNNVGRIKENLPILSTVIEAAAPDMEEPIKSISVNNITYKYSNARENILEHFSANFEKELYMLEGESGKGKSTLLQLIMGIKKIDSGQIIFNNKIEVQDRRITSRVSYLSQYDYTYDRSVSENIFMNKDGSKDGNKIINDIKKYGIETILENQVGLNGENISGGQCKRICFLRMLNMHQKGNLIILDEPFNGLNKELVNNILDFIKEQRSSSIIIVIDHTRIIESLSPKIITL